MQIYPSCDKENLSKKVKQKWKCDNCCEVYVESYLDAVIEID